MDRLCPRLSSARLRIHVGGVWRRHLRGRVELPQIAHWSRRDDQEGSFEDRSQSQGYLPFNELSQSEHGPRFDVREGRVRELEGERRRRRIEVEHGIRRKQLFDGKQRSTDVDGRFPVTSRTVSARRRNSNDTALQLYVVVERPSHRSRRLCFFPLLIDSRHSSDHHLLPHLGTRRSSTLRGQPSHHLPGVLPSLLLGRMRDVQSDPDEEEVPLSE